ncbi:DUF2867 domain-containing protein [Isoptericola cucumis]|uniref:DUF2867 domain-containing protein n=1 Tax=Isoptericola cucumis TaxID=1776856 RepID=A0ABQ2B3Z7_9MICO|nr:DUF2867 domain-containing protein [Isoptericola cucumis]GGI07248.1 hypothetical protein GCM10007368_15220 [Isoptericola cucumis]
MPRSLAVEACPDADVIDVQIVRLPVLATGSRLPASPRWWLHQIFDFRSAPPPVVALMAVRQATAWVVGANTRRSAADVFAVAAEDEREVLSHEHDRHLEFWVGVAVDDGMLQVTTVVRLHGWRGRLYWLPVGALHGPVLRSMMRRAVARSRRDAPDAR